MTALALRRFLALLVLALAPLAAAAQGSAIDFGDLEARLRLDPAQKLQFDAAAGATHRAMLATGILALEMKSRLAQELAKDRPDFDRLLGDPDRMLAQVRPQWREAQEEWTRLYAMLDARQAVIARDYVERRLGSLQDLGADLLKGWRQKPRTQD
ncbi:MAG TPA: hypothetical protein VFE23_19405 [Usitatibacter sp.]|jgi:hypothetical protein|nr:hypothetical protein [Usitatibacter sp.]